MAQNCQVCGTSTIFYIWTSSRRFPRDAYLQEKKITNKRLKKFVKHQGFPVCFVCHDKLKNKE